MKNLQQQKALEEIKLISTVKRELRVPPAATPKQSESNNKDATSRQGRKQQDSIRKPVDISSLPYFPNPAI